MNAPNPRRRRIFSLQAFRLSGFFFCAALLVCAGPAAFAAGKGKGKDKQSPPASSTSPATSPATPAPPPTLPAPTTPVASISKSGVRTITAPDIYNNIFNGKLGALNSGDGCLSIPWEDGKSIFVFGDGSIIAKNKKGEVGNTQVFGHTFLVYDSKTGSATTVNRWEDGKPLAPVPAEPVKGAPKTLLWAGHGIVRDNIFHVYLNRVAKWSTKSSDEPGWQDVIYARVQLPDFKVLDTTRIDNATSKVQYGYFCYPQEGKYLYIYGSGPGRGREPYLMRTTYDETAKAISQTAKEYYSNGRWSARPEDATPLNPDIKLSRKFSVFKYKDKYIMLTNVTVPEGSGPSDIVTYTADKPEGPWGNKKVIYTTIEPAINRDTHSYNASAHPEFTKNGGMLLVDYCVGPNKRAGADHIAMKKADISVYRPRFFWAALDDIIK